MKRIIIYFLFILMISLYGCTKTVQNVSKMNNKNVYNEMSTPYIDAISTLSEEDSNQESDIIINEESIDIVMEYMTFDSAIKMPYTPMNTIAYGEEFINSMKSNPIDEAFYKEFEESSGSAADLAKILDKYLYYWEKEIEITKEALDVRLNDYYVKKINEFAENFLKYKYDEIMLTSQMFSDYDSTGVCFGTMIRYNTCNQVLDMYRELTFTLKYWLYVLETENEDEEYLSLRFVFLE